MTKMFPLLLCIAVGALVGPTAAGAATVTRTTTATTLYGFTGQQCGSVSRAAVTLPRRAFAPRFVEPAVGEDLPSDEGNEVSVATVTGRSLTQIDGSWIAVVEATGSNDVCERPEQYAEGWGTDEIEIVVQYSYRVRVAGCRPVRNALRRGDGPDAIRIRAQGTGCFTARRLARRLFPAYARDGRRQPIRIGVWRCTFVDAGRFPTTCTGPGARRVTWRFTRR